MTQLNSHQLGRQLREEVQFCEEGKRPDLAKMRELIAAGAELNVMVTNDEMDRRTALFMAAESNFYDALVLLTNAGADIEASCFGMTPLGIAAAKGNLDAAKFLISKNANIHAQSYGVNILMEACLYGQTEMAKLLLDSGADPLYKDPRDRTAHSMCRIKYPETAKMIKEHMRNARFNASPELRERLFNRIAHRAVKPSVAAVSIRKFTPKK